MWRASCHCMIMSRMPLAEVTTMLSRNTGNSLAHCHRKEFLRKADLNSADAVVGRLMRRFPPPPELSSAVFPLLHPADRLDLFQLETLEGKLSNDDSSVYAGTTYCTPERRHMLGPTVWSGGFNPRSSRNGSATRPLLMSLRADRSPRILRESTRDGVGGGIM